MKQQLTPKRGHKLESFGQFEKSFVVVEKTMKEVGEKQKKETKVVKGKGEEEENGERE